MSNLEIIRAWKDEEFRLGLSEVQRALLPDHPAGLIELADAELETAGRVVSYSPDINSDVCCWTK